jgi:hypothetical protein
MARGVDYQLDYAVYHALALMAKQLAAPHEDLSITIEPRQLHAQSTTRSDIRVSSTENSAELKLHPTRGDVLEWINRVADDPSMENTNLFTREHREQF